MVEEARLTYLIKDILQTLLRQCRTFHILDSSEFPSESLSLLWSNGSLLLPCKFLYYLVVISQIDLCADNEAGDTRTMMVDLGEPLLLDVLK